MTDGPSRTCLGCRQRRPKRDLVRLVRMPSGVVVVDASGAAPGRGAYVCRDGACVERVLKGGRLSHAFRAPSRPVPELAAAVERSGSETAPSPARAADGANVTWISRR